MKYESYTILSPGPSLDQFVPERDVLKGGPVVAINTAMACYPQADIWLLHSVYAQLVKRLEEYGQTWELLRPSEVWTWSCWDEDPVHKALLGDADFKGWPIGKDVFSADVLGWESKVQWSQVPALCAAGLAIKNGAKVVRLIGLDMEGSGYAGLDGGPLKWTANESDDLRKKWRMQRAAVEQAVRECPSQGITLEVYKAPVDVKKPKEMART